MDTEQSNFVENEIILTEMHITLDKLKSSANVTQLTNEIRTF